ncbi:TPA: hypothetical protein J5F57_003515 [Escherichia coli]|uniref:STY1053 family phage-associated protein n=1 Tax=Hafnia paralvei TaxID=546367 RepID=UPI001B12227E|nr:hypothetical protein [Hafnia paralvei]MBU2672624.1 hypothetical protein [Hafnia paralvei]HBA3651377.1 hypothetical protein [Escherichia coli]
MKYVVSGGATLSFSDGTKFELAQGIHDGSAFPADVKSHWAFKAYARPLDEAEMAKEQNAEDLAASLVLLAEENNTLKAQLATHEETITTQGNEITSLKAQLDAAQAAATGKPADTTDKTDKTGGDAKDAKKQQAAN